jgi:hypothetical protein
MQEFGKSTHSQVFVFLAGVMTCKHIKSFDIFLLSRVLAQTSKTKLLFEALS